MSTQNKIMEQPYHPGHITVMIVKSHIACDHPAAIRDLVRMLFLALTHRADISLCIVIQRIEFIAVFPDRRYVEQKHRYLSPPEKIIVGSLILKLMHSSV